MDRKPPDCDACKDTGKASLYSDKLQMNIRFGCKCARTLSKDPVKTRHIIIKQPGLCPVTKSPVNTHDGLVAMLKEVEDLYPDALILVVETIWSGDLWVKEASEVLMSHAAASGILPDWDDD